MSCSRCILLFTKAARPGRVKTRLVGELTPQQTAQLHSAFVEDVSHSLRRGAFDLAVAWGSADGRLDDVPDVLQGLPIEPQHGGDLGQRLHHGLHQAAQRFDHVAAVGSDHPELDAATVEDAFERLEKGAQVVLGPADDGGYFLIAMERRALHRRLFEDVPWSTSAVCAATQARCRELGLRFELLPTGHDIDIADDLAGLVDRLRRGSAPCAATRRLLRQWGYDL